MHCFPSNQSEPLDLENYSYSYGTDKSSLLQKCNYWTFILMSHNDCYRG